MFSNGPCFKLLDASNIYLVVITRNISRHCQITPGGQNQPQLRTCVLKCRPVAETAPTYRSPHCQTYPSLLTSLLKLFSHWSCSLPVSPFVLAHPYPSGTPFHSSTIKIPDFPRYLSPLIYALCDLIKTIVLAITYKLMSPNLCLQPRPLS